VTITVLLADDQAMVRSGFRMILETQPDIAVVAEAGDGRQAVEMARAKRPDVALVDIRMPGLDGIDVTRALTAPGPGDRSGERRTRAPDPVAAPRIVIVTTFDTDAHVYGALRAGAVGFLLKDAGPALLIEAVRAAHSGESLISPSVTVRLLQQLMPARAASDPSSAAPGPSKLSERELQIARSIARGRTNHEIAAEWFISVSTVKTHITRIQGKLGLRNRVEIAAWAWENHLLEASPQSTPIRD
jgi:DNA-binding NarL/FixJ family response regulator